MPIYLELWLSTLIVILLSIDCYLIGAWLIQQKRFFIGYSIPFLFIVIVALTRQITCLEFTYPFSVFVFGRTEFAVLACATIILFFTISSRLQNKKQRLNVRIFMTVMAVYFILPFLSPCLTYSYFSNLETKLTHAGLCMQSTRYSCGPAASVTALRKQNIRAEEGIIAIHAFTNPITGTQPDSLCTALNKLYFEEHTSCEYQRFESLAELIDKCPVITQIKGSLFVEHYVTILRITNRSVEIADPLIGLCIYPQQQFKAMWTKKGIIIKQHT